MHRRDDRQLPKLAIRVRAAGEQLGRRRRCDLEPRDPRGSVWRRKLGSLETKRQSGRKHVPADLDGHTLPKLFAQLLRAKPSGRCLADDLTRHLQSKELLKGLSAGERRLPEQEIGCRVHLLAASQASRHPARKPQSAGAMPVRSRSQCSPRFDVQQPLRPVRIAEVAFAVSTAEEIHLQHRESAGGGQRARLQSGHSTRFVHLLRKRVDIEDRTVISRALESAA